MGHQRWRGIFGAQKTLAPTCNRTTIPQFSSPEPIDYIDYAFRALLAIVLLNVWRRNYPKSGYNKPALAGFLFINNVISG